jgi:hypothetical protein
LFDYTLRMPFPDGAVLDWMDMDLPSVSSLFASG